MKAPSVRRDNLNCMRPVGAVKESPAQKLLEQLFEAGILPKQDWDKLEPRVRLELKGLTNLDRFLLRLVDHGLLTPYQAARVQSGQKHGLLLGPYRLLDRLGAGTSSVVFKAEHRETRQSVALKVLIPGLGDDELLVRFDTERRSIAQLQHPHIVRLMDVGEASGSDPDAPLLYYYAMEFVPGHDLEQFVKERGRMPGDQVCQLAFQIASALHCAHQHGMVHRDINPSNILWTGERQAKLLDFGLARAQQRHTQPGAILGALEFIAPEQMRDGSAVDIRADLFALGSTLYYCVTGQPPFSARGQLQEVIQSRATTPAPSAKLLTPELSPRIDALLERLMALDPAHRFQTPRELMTALEEFVGPQAELSETPTAVPTRQSGGRVLIVTTQPELAPELDHATETLDLMTQHLENPAGLASALWKFDPDIVMLDLGLPQVQSLELVQTAGKQPEGRFRKVMVFTTGPMPSDAPRLLGAGVDDILPLPQDPAAIQVRLRSLAQLQEAQRRMFATAAKMPAPVKADVPSVKTVKKKPGFFGWLLGKR